MALSPAVKDYWLLRLAAQHEPWAQAQPMTAWARLADSHAHLRMDARAMRDQFYALVERYEPTPRPPHVTDLERRQQQKLREVCIKLSAFQQQKEEKRAVLTAYTSAVAELEASQVSEHCGGGRADLALLLARMIGRNSKEGEEGETNVAKFGLQEPSKETPLEISVPTSDTSDHDDDHSATHAAAAAALKRRRETFWQQQTQLLRMQFRVDERQAELYGALLAKKAAALTDATECDAIERELQRLEQQVATQCDQTRCLQQELDTIGHMRDDVE